MKKPTIIAIYVSKLIICHYVLAGYNKLTQSEFLSYPAYYMQSGPCNLE